MNNNDAVFAVNTIAEQDEGKMQSVTVKISIDAAMLKKMIGVTSLYADEINIDAKKPEIVSFFLKKGFEALVASGEFDKRLKTVLGG